MYVRAKEVRRGKKVYGPYWQVVTNHWVNGRPKQKVVAHLGKAPDAESADGLARLWGHLCGVVDCHQAATERREGVPVGKRTPQPVKLCAEHAEDFGNGVSFDIYHLDPHFPKFTS